MEIPPELLDAALIDPSADGPRLVIADWLEEHGDADWAGLIRAQCRLAAREREPLPRGAVGRLEAEARRLEASFRERLRAIDEKDSVYHVEIVRGFVQTLEVWERELAGPIAGLARLVPLLESLSAARLGLAVSSLPDFAALRGLRRLELGLNAVGVSWKEVAPLADCPALERVFLWSRDYEALGCEHLPRLRAERIGRLLAVEPARPAHQTRLALGSGIRPLSGGVAADVSEAEVALLESVPGVRRLTLRGFGDGLPTPLAGLPSLGDLKVLRLEGLAGDLPDALLGLPPLRELSIDFGPHPGHGSPLAAALREQPDLRSLAIGGREVGMIGDVLDALTGCTELRALSLAVQNLPDPLILRLPRLATLDLPPSGSARPRVWRHEWRGKRSSELPVNPVTFASVALRLPPGFVPEPGATATSAAWREDWGDHDPADDLATLGPARVTVDVLPTPATVAGRKALLLSPTPAGPLAVTGRAEAEGICLRNEGANDLRAAHRRLWAGKSEAVRVGVEFPVPLGWVWGTLAEAILDSVEIDPKASVGA